MVGHVIILLFGFIMMFDTSSNNILYIEIVLASLDTSIFLLSFDTDYIG